MCIRDSLILREGKSPGILPLQYLPDMGIHRKGLHMMKRKQADTVRHFISHAEALLQCFTGLLIAHPADLLQTKPSGSRILRCFSDIFGAVSQIAALQFLQGQGRHVCLLYTSRCV